MLLVDGEDKFINAGREGSTMVSPELVAYIQSLLRNGYPEGQVKDYLLRAGHSATDIDAAFGQLRIRQALAPSGRNWFWIAGAILGLGIGGVIIALLLFSPATSYSLRASADAVEVRPGGTLTIVDRFSATSPQTVSVVHTLYDPIGTPVGNTEQRVTLAKGARTERATLRIPGTAAAGPYTVNVVSTDAKGKETTTTLSVNVVAPRATCADGMQNQGEGQVDCGGPCAACPSVETPTTAPSAPAGPATGQVPAEGCPGGCDDKDISTRDACVDNVCTHTSKPVCGNGICNDGETSAVCTQDCGAGPAAASPDTVIEEARGVAATDEERAIALCSALPRPVDRDRCFSVVASDAGKSTLCAAIAEDITRDQCYIDFALSKNEFDVCEKIVNRYLRGSCNSLRNLRQLERQRQQEAATNTAASTTSGTACPAERPAACDDTVSVVCGDNKTAYSNSCLACKDAAVTSYVEGAC